MEKGLFNLDRRADKEIFALAWPSIAEQILEMMVGMVSTIFMGRISTNAVAAVGMVNMLMGFLQTVFAGLSIGTTVIVARITGEGDKAKARSALIQSIYMSLLVGLSLALFGKIFSSSLLKLFFGQADVQVFNIGIIYFNVILYNVPFFVLDIIISGAMRGAGDTKTPMIITGAVNVLNVFLNASLIFGVKLLNIPALGVMGSAIAVTISRIIAVLAKLLVLYNIKGLKINLSFKDDYRIKPDLIKRIINIGIPGFIEQAIMQGGFLAVQIIIVSIGTIAMAAYQVGININALAVFPIFGFAIANTTLVGQSLGEKQPEKAEHYAYESLKISMIVAFIIGLLMAIFARQLASIYTNDPYVIQESVWIVRTFGVLEPLIAILNLCSSTLKAAGDIKYVMITSFVGLWSFRVMLSFSLNKWFALGLTAVMIGIFFDFSSRSFMYILRMKRGKWKYLNI